jgi:predicted ATPase/transcriptional regulator with XRE-family HTH domain
MSGEKPAYKPQGGGRGAGGAASFGERLRQLREAAGLTQEELASRANLTAKAVSALERGERKRPYPHTVRSLAEALELSEGQRSALTGTIPTRSGGAAALPVEAAAVSAPALPVSLTPLLGREREVEEVVGLLLGRGGAAARLLTLTGPGGIGKSRLAIEAAKKAAGHFPDGLAFVALAPLGDAALVMPTLSQALGLREAAGVRPLEVLSHYLRERRLLLVLDNFEHVSEAAPEVVDLLGSCPKLSVLVSSRAPLRVRGEREYPVFPLAVPDPTRTPGVKEVAASAAATLFIERAKEASGSFELTQANAAAVAAICWRLEGLPLALELAAAQTRFLGPTALLSRLDQALEARGARDLPERQRTMRATLDWSHELLDEPERQLFRRLSVFTGGFELEAAEEVCAAGALEAEEVLVLLGKLVEQSLVVAEVSWGVERLHATSVRYRMLEPVRQYAQELLEERGEEEGVRARHAAHYLALAEEAEPRIKGQDQIEWLDRLEGENDNFRAAIGWLLEAGDVQTAARFGWALSMYWVMRARHGEGRLLMEQTLAQGGDDLPAQMRARVFWALGACVYGLGDDEHLLEISEEGAALFRRAGDRHGEGYMLGMMGFATLRLNELERAGRALEEALEVFREHEDAWGSAHVLNYLAIAPLRRGEYRRAAGYAEEALALTRQTGDRLAANISLYILAQAAWGSGDHELAARHLRESLVLASELGEKVDSAYCMQGLAMVAEARGEPRRAARLLGAAEVMLEAAGFVLYAQASNEPHQRAASAAREVLGNKAWNETRDEGRAMTFEQAVAYALEDDEA